MVRRFGFGEKPGSNLPGEVVGIVNPLERWNHYSETSIPMGQEIGVTGLQIMRAFTAIANGGRLVTPTIEPRDAAWRTYDNSEQILRPDIARHTRQVMRRTVTEGTGRRAQSDLYTIFGKTGTAERPDLENGGYHDRQYVASFIGGAPTDSPRIIVGCFIHRPNPDKGYYGGLVAAPPVKEVIEETLLYLGVVPDVEPEEPQDTVDRLAMQHASH
jgi:cell division protein FtsI/penicillin-binding protein 2